MFIRPGSCCYSAEARTLTEGVPDQLRAKCRDWQDAVDRLRMYESKGEMKRWVPDELGMVPPVAGNASIVTPDVSLPLAQGAAEGSEDGYENISGPNDIP